MQLIVESVKCGTVFTRAFDQQNEAAKGAGSTVAQRLIVFVLGGPGSGKGTQVKRSEKCEMRINCLYNFSNLTPKESQSKCCGDDWKALCERMWDFINWNERDMS